MVLSKRVSGAALLCIAIALAGCEKDHSDWCDAMMLKPNNEWVDPEFEQFSQRCLEDNQSQP